MDRDAVGSFDQGAPASVIAPLSSEPQFQDEERNAIESPLSPYYRRVKDRQEHPVPRVHPRHLRLCFLRSAISWSRADGLEVSGQRVGKSLTN